jgi:diguanylate cyclase (GGDEF)-like protein
VVGTIQDISLRKTTEQKIKKLAYYDSITGLANRTRLNQLATEAIQLAKSIRSRVGFVFLDLDHFKRINDTFGHDAGDELLRQVAERLRHCVRPNDTVGSITELDLSEKTVARLGGDEFIILLTRLVQPSDIEVVAKRVNEHLTRKFSIAGKDVFISGSLGISLYPDNGNDVDDLMRHADAAMYHAKNNGRNRFEFFTSSIERDIQHRISIETRLHQALDRGDFILHYQPRIDIKNNQIVAVEALLRWIDPNEGMISPDQFIPVAEETGLIIPIGEWVLNESCQQLTKWRDQFGTSITMSINLSPVQFNAADKLLDTLRNAIQVSSIDPACIELELTENALFQNIDASVQLANDFKSLGIRLSIDDFGTGYSSLQQIRRFPVDIIKIDRSFIRDVLNNTDDALIVKTAISLGHNLRLRVVAEGVENEEQMAFLKKHQCDEVQGYLFGKPQSAHDIGHLLLREAQDGLEGDHIDRVLGI